MSSLWEVAFEIVAPQQVVEGFFRMADSVIAGPTSGTALAQQAAFELEGLAMGEDSLSATDPELKIVTVTMASRHGTCSAARTGTIHRYQWQRGGAQFHLDLAR